MKISVLIAAHQEDLSRSLASVRAQAHKDWELLVVEYGVRDAARALVRDFAEAGQQPGQYLSLGANHGPASARNRLIELANAEFVAFLDPADEWTPAHLGNAAARFASGADVVAGDVRISDTASRHAPTDLAAPSRLGANPTQVLFARDALPVPSAVAFRRDLAKRVGPFDVRFHTVETRDFWLRCALAGARFATTHRSTCRHPRSAPDLAHALIKAEQTVQFYDKYHDLVAVSAAGRRRLLSASLVTHGRLLRRTDPIRASRCFRRAWSLQPVYVQTLGHFALASGLEPAEPAQTAPTLSHGPKCA